MVEANKGYQQPDKYSRSRFSDIAKYLHLISPALETFWFGRRLESFFQRRESREGRVDRFIEIIGQTETPRIAVFVENHETYPDPFGFLPYLRKIIKNTDLDGIRVVLAKSLEDGEQGETGKYYKLIEEYFKQKKNSVETVKLVRSQDEELGLKKGRGNVEAKNQMADSYNDKKLLVILPQGETWEGKKVKKEEGGDGIQRNGMKEFTKEQTGLAKALVKVLFSDIGFVILPGAIYESYNIFDPDAKDVTPELEAEFKRRPLPYTGRTFATATVGEPRTEVDYNDYLIKKGLVDRTLNLHELGMFMKKYPLTLIEFVMVENVARMLPPEMQRFYREYIENTPY